MIYLIIGIAFGIILGWIIKMPFSHAFLKRELNENMIILDKIMAQKKKNKKAVIK
jgi:hypothetical protein